MGAAGCILLTLLAIAGIVIYGTRDINRSKR